MLLLRLTSVGFAVALLTGSASGLARNPAPTPTCSAEFLERLVGDWHGAAVRTPRGRLPYDLQFRRTRDGAVSAVANPGAAQHYWTFLVDKAQLRLRFLTTFRGNEEPTWLTAEQASSELVRFRGERLPHLRVVVTLRPEEIDISVFLHDRPHVDIELRRGPRQTPGDRTD